MTLGHAYGNPVAGARDAAGDKYTLPLTDDSESFVYLGAALTF
jgi:hypothetical protein